MVVRLHSLQVGTAREILTEEGPLRTGLCKSSQSGALYLGPRGLDGDGWANLEYHGLEDQAVCVMPRQHYAWWWTELGLDAQSFPFGSFGENFTVDGQDETTVFLGDRWEIGEAEVEVTKERPPCSTLGKVWHRSDFAALMGGRGFTGWYLRVLQPGLVASGQVFKLLARNPKALSVADRWAQKRP